MLVCQCLWKDGPPLPGEAGSKVHLADLSLQERPGIKSLISDGEILRGLVHVHLRHNLLLLQNK